MSFESIMWFDLELQASDEVQQWLIIDESFTWALFLNWVFNKPNLRLVGVVEKFVDIL